MIKCIWYLKSLKQLLFILLISCFIFWLGSSASATLSSVWLIKYPSSVNNQYDIWFLRGGWIISDFLWQSKWIVALDNQRLFWWDNNWLPYVYLKSNNRAYLVQWQYDTFYSCDLFTWDSLPANCSPVSIDYSWDLSFIQNVMSNFFNRVLEDDLVYYNYFNNQYIGATWEYNNNWLDICWNSSVIWKSLCFRWWYCYNDYTPCAGSFVNSKNYTDLTFGLLPYSEIGRSPWQSWYGDGSSDDWNIQSPDWVELDSTQGALDYYENYYGWNSDICYIGVDSMNILWGASGVSFNQWSWLNIFEWFNQLYGSSDPQKVYVWINSWLINYRNWFNRSDINEPPLYLVNYNYNNNSVDIYYDNLNFPFTNNPLGVYFMSDFIDYKWTLCDSSCGSDVVSYCDIKLRWWTFDDIIDNSSKESINQYVSQKNINNWLNWDWTEKTSPFSYSSTWTDYTGAVDFINYYVSKINWLINTDYDWPWFLPTYIILFMLALILFRFMSH